MTSLHPEILPYFFPHSTDYQNIFSSLSHFILISNINFTPALNTTAFCYIFVLSCWLVGCLFYLVICFTILNIFLRPSFLLYVTKSPTLCILAFLSHSLPSFLLSHVVCHLVFFCLGLKSKSV